MASEVSICNQAISWVGGTRITSLDDGTKEANLCKDNYAALRDAVLSEGAWTFATTRFIPAADAASPAYGYAYSFSISNTILTVLEVQNQSTVPNGSNTLDWRMEGNAILCDEQIIYVKAIEQITDPNEFHPLFVQALSARIALDICIPLTRNKALMRDMGALYQEKLETALFVDGSQGKSDRLRSPRYKQVR